MTHISIVHVTDIFMLSNTSSSQTEGHDLKPIRLRERREKNIKLKVLKGFSLRAGRCWNGIKQAVYEVLTKFFIYLKGSYVWNMTWFKCPPRLLTVARIRVVQFSMTLVHRSG